MKKWPENNKPADFEDIIKPLHRAVSSAYSLTRINRDKDIPYDGFDVGEIEKAHAIGAEKLKAESLEYSETSQGRDALTEILSLAVQIGFEQGRRVDGYPQQTKDLLIKAYSEIIEEQRRRLDQYEKSDEVPLENNGD